MATASPLLSLPSMGLDRKRVEAAMLAAVRTSDDYLTEIASHLITAGGKRLRPVMAIAASQVGNGESTTESAIQGGIACELVHLGSLYHDDVMDEAETRRGVETVNAKWGNLQAILAGDFLLARASEIAASLGTEVAILLSQTIGRLCEGQIEELRHTYDIGRPVPSYLASIEGKTASLYSTAARIGGIVANHDRNVIDALTSYGTSYGMVFQIVDDILDLTASDSELGKPAGHDMVEGVYTLPVLLTMSGEASGSEELKAMLGAPLTEDQQKRAIDIVRSGPGMNAAVKVARDYVHAAEAACSQLPAGDATDAFRSATEALLDSVL